MDVGRKDAKKQEQQHVARLLSLQYSLRRATRWVALIFDTLLKHND
jgi:hypothetical protein